jgi:hypothetical protein
MKRAAYGHIASTPSGTASLDLMYRNLAYVFACVAGAAIIFSISSSDFGPYEGLVANFAVLYLALTFSFVILSTKEPDQRTRRLLRCILISIITICIVPFLNRYIRFDSLLISSPKIEFVDVLAIAVALASNLPWIWRLTSDPIKKILSTTPAIASGLFAAFSALIAILLHS